MIKDLLGQPIEVGNFVVTSQNARIVVARVEKITDSFVYVKPANSHAGKNAYGQPRRGTPKQKVMRKLHYNVSVVTDQDIVIATLKDALNKRGITSIEQIEK